MPGLTEEQRRLIAEGAIVPRRERIAIAAMQGLLGNPEEAYVPDIVAREAVSFADALIEELDKR